MTGPHGGSQLLILNQMAGPLTRELAEAALTRFESVSLLTGHPDTLRERSPDGVRLHRSLRYRRGSLVARTLTWTLYAAHALSWLALRPRAAHVVLYTNPPFLPWLGYLMAVVRRQRYTLIIHDVYPDVVVRRGLLSESNPITRVWRWANRKAYERASVVLTIGDCMAETLSTQFRSPASGRVEVIYPWADTDRLRPIPKEENPFALRYGQMDKLTVMYSGNMGLGHDIETLLETAQELAEFPDVHFMLIGSGPKWSVAQRTVTERGLDNVTLLGWLSDEEVRYSQATADLAVVSLPGEQTGLAFPSKAMTALAVGAPVVFLAQPGSCLSDLLRRWKCGWSVRPGDVHGLSELVLRLRAEPDALRSAKARGREAAMALGSLENAQSLLDAMPLAPPLETPSRRDATT